MASIPNKRQPCWDFLKWKCCPWKQRTHTTTKIGVSILFRRHMWRPYIIGIKHCFSYIIIHQVPWEVLKTEAEGRGFQHLPRDLANVNALKNHVRSLLLHKNWKHLLHFALFFALFVLPFHRCRANAISTYYACSRAGQYISRDGSNSVARHEHIESCVAVH